MLGHQVDTEVTLEVAPDGVNVVGTVLRAVALDEEGRALHAVVVRVAPFESADPPERDAVQTGLRHLLDACAGDGLWHR